MPKIKQINLELNDYQIALLHIALTEHKKPDMQHRNDMIDELLHQLGEQ